MVLEKPHGIFPLQREPMSRPVMVLYSNPFLGNPARRVKRAPVAGQVPVKVKPLAALLAEWQCFAPIFPTVDASPTLGMTRENSSVK
jgi:hypothetical protein